MTVEDRYYNRVEYQKFTVAQKLGLKCKREKRGHQPGEVMARWIFLHDQ